MTNTATEDISRTKHYVLLVSILSSFTTPFMASSINVAIPEIGRSLHLDALTLNWVVTGFLVASAACLLPLGRAADIYGRKRVYVAGLFVFTLPSMLCATAPSGGWLILGRVLQGIGGAMVFGTGMAIVTSVFARGERGRVLGLNVAAVYLGLSLGPPAGGLVVDSLGWRWLFAAHLFLGAFAAVVALFGLRGEWKDTHQMRYDTPGAILYGTALSLTVYGLGSVATRIEGRAALAAGVFLLTAFVGRQTTYAHPLLDVRLFRNAVFAFSNLAALIHYSATFATGYLVSIFLQTVQGMSARETGLVLLSQPIVMALVSPVAGRLSDRVQPRLLASAGMAITCAGLAVFTQLNAAFPLYAIVLNLLVIGAGFGLFSSPNTNAIMGAVEPGRYGVASAAVGTMRVVGQAMSMALVNVFFAVHLEARPLTPAEAIPLTRAIHAAFLVFSIVCFAGVWASMARGRVAHEPLPQGQETNH